MIINKCNGSGGHADALSKLKINQYESLAKCLEINTLKVLHMYRVCVFPS